MQFVNPETGRKMKALPGQVFWVTNPEHLQKSKCAVQFQRKGRGSICTGPAFSLGTFNEWFEPA
jgi:hypothetical protein